LKPAAAGGEALWLEALRFEALRLNDRYLTEVVLGFGLCPWAESALREGRVMRQVITDQSPPPEAALELVDKLEGGRPGGGGVDAPGAWPPAIGLVIYPRLPLTAGAFEGYAEKVRRADRGRRGDGLPPFVVAAFHPFASGDFETAQELVSFIRRTPDPTLQLVRHELLEQARTSHPTVSDDVTRQNHARVLAQGRDRLDQVIRDIRDDRDRTYSGLAAR
jgi:hypothetical protein